VQVLQVGRSTTRGALTLFPVMGEFRGDRGYTTAIDRAALSELVEGPQVETLTVTNQGSEPLLMLEGVLLEGGWQNRMLARSVLVAGGGRLDVEVVCVEAGRWRGRRTQKSRSRRASTRVRAGLNSGESRQHEVWQRVRQYEGRYGPSVTSSFVDHAERAAGEVAALIAGLRHRPGQVGVAIGIGGSPVSAEIFDSPQTLAEQFASIVGAAAMDAVGQPQVATPASRAQEFVDRALRLRRHFAGEAGDGITLRGEDDDVEVSVLGWHDREVHLVATSRRHALTAAA
jgi:hypothetical protein